MRLGGNLLMLYAIVGMVSMSMGACAEQKRIKPSRVTVKNHEQFVAQIKRDFPASTPVQDVLRYLKTDEILHSYRPPGSFESVLPSFFEEDGYDHRVGIVQCMLERISYAFFVIRTDLWIKIYISEEEKVLEIKHDLVYTFL